MPSLSMTRPCSSLWNSRKSPSSSAPPPLEGASRSVAVRVKVSAVRVGRARRPRMPPPLLSRRETAAASDEGAARATAAERDIERRNGAAVATRVDGSRTGAVYRARTVGALLVWPSAPRPDARTRELPGEKGRRFPSASARTLREMSEMMSEKTRRSRAGTLTTTSASAHPLAGATRAFATIASVIARGSEAAPSSRAGRARSEPTTLSRSNRSSVFPPASTAKKKVPRSTETWRGR